MDNQFSNSSNNPSNNPSNNQNRLINPFLIDPKNFNLGKDAIPPPFTEGTIYLSRAMTGREINVTRSRVQIIKGGVAWPYLLVNPHRSEALTEVYYFSATNPITIPISVDLDMFSVANYREVHFFLKIHSITGTWDVILRTKDPTTLSWFNTQTLFSGLTSINDSGYAFAGPSGVAKTMGVYFSQVVPGGIAFTITMFFKSSNGGGLYNDGQIIYLGGPDVTTINGFPLLPDSSRAFVLGENVDLWAVSSMPDGCKVRVFQL